MLAEAVGVDPASIEHRLINRQGNLRRAESGADAQAEPGVVQDANAGVNFRAHGRSFEFAPRSLWLFTAQSPTRQLAVWLVAWRDVRRGRPRGAYSHLIAARARVQVLHGGRDGVRDG